MCFSEYSCHGVTLLLYNFHLFLIIKNLGCIDKETVNLKTFLCLIKNMLINYWPIYKLYYQSKMLNNYVFFFYMFLKTSLMLTIF